MVALSSPEAPKRPFRHPSDGSPDIYHMHSSRSSSTGSADLPLLPDALARSLRPPTISPTSASSRLNPSSSAQASTSPPLFTSSRTQSTQSVTFNRVPSEDSQALASHPSSLTPNRTSMLLYRLAGKDERLTPPNLRHSLLSNTGDSVFTVSYDSKYPFGSHTPQKLVAYPFDPSLHIDTPEDDDALHDPRDNTPLHASSRVTIRGFVNIGVLVLVILALLCLFIFYPVWHYVIEGHGKAP